MMQLTQTRHLSGDESDSDQWQTSCEHQLVEPGQAESLVHSLEILIESEERAPPLPDLHDNTSILLKVKLSQYRMFMI